MSATPGPSSSTALTVPPAGTVDRHEGGERRAKRGWSKWPRVIVLWYTVAFIAQEVIGAYLSVPGQIGALAILTLVAINHALFGYRNARTAAVVMSALFVTRLAAVSLPAAGISVASRTVMVAILALIVTRLAIWVMANDVVETRAVEGFLLRRPIINIPTTLVVVALSGVPIGLLAYALLDPAPLVITPLVGSLIAAWVVASVYLALGAVGEELLYRQLVAAMVQHTAGSQTSLISGLLFASTYLGTHNPAFVGVAFFTGAWFAWSCERTGSIVGPIVAHVIINLIVFVVAPTAGWTFPI